MAQLSHPYMTTGEIIALTIWIFLGKVMSLLFNMLSRLVIAFLPRSSSVQLLSRVRLFATPWTAECQASLSITNFQSYILTSWLHSPSWRRKWQPIPELSPGKFHGERRLMGYIPWGCKELDTTEHTHTVTICSDFGAQENKVCLCFHCFSIYCHEVMGPNAMILVFSMLSFKPSFSLSSFTFIKRFFSSSLLSAIRVVSSKYLRLLIISQQSWFQLALYPVQYFTWCTLHIS